MRRTSPGGQGLHTCERAEARRRSVAGRSLLVAVVATIGVLAPGAYVGASAASGAVPGHAVAAKSTKHSKKPKKCKKGQVLRHNKCVAKSSSPVY